jgi:hypothetical protein
MTSGIANQDAFDEQPVPEPISDELEVLAGALIDYGLDLLSEVGELAPALAAEDEQGNRTLLSFDDEDIEECLDEMRSKLRASAAGKAALDGLAGRAVRYAFAYDGAIALPDSPNGYEPALIVEYGERGLSQGYSAYLLYRNPGDPQEFVCTEPAAAGEEELLV